MPVLCLGGDQYWFGISSKVPSFITANSASLSRHVSHCRMSVSIQNDLPFLSCIKLLLGRAALSKQRPKWSHVAIVFLPCILFHILSWGCPPLRFTGQPRRWYALLFLVFFSPSGFTVSALRRLSAFEFASYFRICTKKICSHLYAGHHW